jgi:hypothetical protein
LKVMDVGMDALLDGEDGKFHFADVGVARSDIERKREAGRLKAIKFHITVDGGDKETTLGVKLNDRSQFNKQSLLFTVQKGIYCTKFQFTGDGVKKMWPWT